MLKVIPGILGGGSPCINPSGSPGRQTDPSIGNVRLLCKGHNLMKAEQHLGRTFVARFRKC
jgi:hypothetical protein